ncbi:MAG: hypothetical protein N2F24_07160 [Deltaproteobacteria bacterium]
MIIFIERIAKKMVQKAKGVSVQTFFKDKELLVHKTQVEKQKEILSLFGTIEYEKSFDNKAQRHRK